MALVRLIGSSVWLTLAAAIALVAAAIAVAVAGWDMRVASALALYFVVWWILLFAVLPFGVRSQAETGEVVAGTEPGAPAAPALREKAIWTTIVADIVFLVTVAAFPLAGL